MAAATHPTGETSVSFAEFLEELGFEACLTASRTRMAGS